MPPKLDKEVVFFLANPGKSPSDGDSDYFEKAKQVMTLITEKKIFLRLNDEVAIMLTAHSDDNAGNKQISCTNLYWKNSVPSWKTVKHVQKLKQSDEVFHDWNTAFSNTLQEIKEIEKATRIILILLFDCHPTCPGIKEIDTEAIAESVKKLEIQLLWIGSKPLKDLPEDKLNESEKAIMEVVKLVDGKYMTMEETLPALRIFKHNKQRFVAWKCDLELGNIKIPISMYVQATRPVKTPTFQTVNTKVENDVEKSIVVKSEREYVDRHKESYSIEDTISGYMYGRQCIPVPEADKAGMVYKSGLKSFKVYGFVPRTSIVLEDLCGDTSRFVIPQTPSAAKAFYSLVQAMNNAERVAVVRRIYQINNCPKMGILFPYVDQGEPWGFIYIEILYTEDRRVQQTRPLNSVKNRLTEDKKNAVGNLIDSMMLTSSEDEPEPFYPGTVHSPGLQHLYNCMVHRALNPDKPVPEMDEHLKKLLEPPESIKINSEPVIKQLRDLFPIPDEQISLEKSNETTVEVPVPVLAEVKKIETKMEENRDTCVPVLEESNADLDELFDDDMDM